MLQLFPFRNLSPKRNAIKVPIKFTRSLLLESGYRLKRERGGGGGGKIVTMIIYLSRNVGIKLQRFRLGLRGGSSGTALPETGPQIRARPGESTPPAPRRGQTTAGSLQGQYYSVSKGKGQITIGSLQGQYIYRVIKDKGFNRKRVTTRSF